MHKPEKVLESDEYKIPYNFPVQTDKCLEHNRPDIAVIDNKNKRCQQINTSCTFDSRIERKEEGKCMNYNQLKYEIARV